MEKRYTKLIPGARVWLDWKSWISLCVTEAMKGSHMGTSNHEWCGQGDTRTHTGPFCGEDKK